MCDNIHLILIYILNTLKKIHQSMCKYSSNICICMYLCIIKSPIIKISSTIELIKEGFSWPFMAANALKKLIFD